MEYPKNHRQIVDDLTTGRFVLSRDKHFEELVQQEEFYAEFFKVSFDYNLNITTEYAYLISKDTDENMSRDISIFFAIFCYELDKQGKNFLDGLQYAEYSFEEINLLFDNSSYIDLIQSNKQLKDADARRRLIFGTMARKNIIEKINEDRFYFTPAYKVFIEFAKTLAENKAVEAN
ncbi:MAG TPA: hypothetical protein VN922_23650 [Bacteroidia bacterium]|jgi:hypothetical protein|nr:hypothetical protein [Bacteroidia bacterium]